MISGRSIVLKFADLCVLSAICVCILVGTCWAGEETRTIVDSRGIAVTIPEEIERVVTISDGLVETVMFLLGEDKKIVGVGGYGFKQILFNYSFTAADGKIYEYRDGMYPVTYLSSWIQKVPQVRVPSGSAINYETLAGFDPDLVIFRVGICPYRSMKDEGVQKTIRTIEGLGIPVVVLMGDSCFDEPTLSTISNEIRIIGKVFGKEEEAGTLADYLEAQTQMVFERTEDIPEAERPSVLVFSASASARKNGGSGSVSGIDMIDSYFIEKIVHAKNAFRDTGNPILSAEQLLALDPDVIILGTYTPYPEELYLAPYYQNLGELSAVKNRRISSFPCGFCNCAKRIEYPIEVMVIAKAAYPERFSDIDLGEWLLDFYKNVYDVDDDTAKALRSAQWMDWTVNEVRI